MALKKKAFVRYELEENQKKIDTVVPVKFNIKEELPKLELLKDLLQQEQNSTAIKQAIDIASEVLLERKNLVILSHVLNNYRRNKRKGVVTYDDTNYEKFINRNTNERF